MQECSCLTFVRNNVRTHAVPWHSCWAPVLQQVQCHQHKSMQYSQPLSLKPQLRCEKEVNILLFGWLILLLHYCWFNFLCTHTHTAEEINRIGKWVVREKQKYEWISLKFTFVLIALYVRRDDVLRPFPYLLFFFSIFPI